MATQNVYFNNPADITTLQSEVSVLQNDNGFGQVLDSAGLTGANDWLQSYVYGGSLVGGDVNDAKHKGGFFYGGNVKTGQEMFFGTGTANSAGLTWSTGTKYNFASAGKIVTGLVCAKMIEERLINPYAPIYTLSPSLNALFTGSAQYYTDITVTIPAGFPADGTYTATTGAYDLKNVTLSDVLHMSLGLIDDFFCLPGSGMFSTIAQWSTGPSSLLASTATPTTIDKAILVQSGKFVKSLLTQGTGAIGYAAKIYNGKEINPVTEVSNAVSNAINLVTSGAVPLAYAPGTKSEQLPYNTRTLASTYDTAYILLGYILDERLKALSFNTINFATYANAKFFAPLGMSNTKVVLQEDISPVNLADSSFRRSLVYAAAGFPFSFDINTVPTYPSYGCSNYYSTGAAIDYVLYGLTGSAGPNVWSSDVPDDGISKLTKLFYQQTGSTGAGNPIGNSPIVASIGDYGKLLQLIANKGALPNGSGRLLKTESWNYFIASKIGALTFLGAYTSVSDVAANENSGNTIFTMGASRIANDVSNTTTYGYDETTLFFDGAMGCKFYADFYTGNWFVCGVPEVLLSTGDLQLPQSTIDALTANSGVKATNIALSPTLQFHGQNFLLGMIQNN
jgi:CubicO group peptidase (beta-lactamase class C family)